MGEGVGRLSGDPVERLYRPALPAWNDNPIWTSEPKVTLFRDVLKRSLDDNYSGKLSRASAVVMAISSSRLTERASPLILGFNPSSRRTMAETAGASRRGPSGP